MVLYRNFKIWFVFWSYLRTYLLTCSRLFTQQFWVWPNTWSYSLTLAREFCKESIPSGIYPKTHRDEIQIRANTYSYPLVSTLHRLSHLIHTTLQDSSYCYYPIIKQKTKVRTCPGLALPDLANTSTACPGKLEFWVNNNILVKVYSTYSMGHASEFF